VVQVIWPDPGLVEVSDRGLAYGDGLFETIRVDCCRPFLLERHLRRLLDDAGRLAIPLVRADLESAVREALERLAPADATCVLKVMLTRGSGGRGYRIPETIRPRLIVSVHPMPPAPDAGGVAASTSSVPLLVHPAMAGMKSLERMQQVLASRELQPDEFERIMPDADGNLIEGTRTNLLVRSGDVWITPPRGSLAVAGVMRAELLDCLQQQGEQTEQRPITRDDLEAGRLQGLWLTNSVTGIVPVRRLDGVELPVSNHLATIAPHGFFTGS
jgi:4-amino-4-deoxychorismate lyase